MNGSDRDIQSWENRLNRQSKRGWDNYIRRRIDLSIPRTIELWGIAGEFMYVEQASSESAKADIRLNRNTNDQIDLEIATTIKTIFTSFYITNTAQAGEWIDIIIGINFEYYKTYRGIGTEAQPVIEITNALADTNTIGAANVCNRILICADVGNTGLTWINFGAPAVDGLSIPFNPGDIVSVPSSNTNRINALFKVANDSVFLTYEV